MDREAGAWLSTATWADAPAGAGRVCENFSDPVGQVRSPQRRFVPADRPLDRRRAKAIRQLLHQRRMRAQFFPADLFADPAWDMLLDLYAAKLEREPVSVSSLCIAAGVPTTTALRWIKAMTDAGLFIRKDDPRDGRRILIGLSDDAGAALARYFDALEE